MNELTTCFKINNRTVSTLVKAEKFSPGLDEVLFNIDDSPAKHSTWRNKGYTIQPFLSKQKNAQFREGIKNLIIKILNELDIKTDEFELYNYHKYVNDEQHLRFCKYITAGTAGTGGFSIDLLPIHISEIEKRIEEICNCPVTSEKRIEVNGKTIVVQNFFLRVVRPQRFKDNNPPHRDVHLERSRGAVNLYFPFSGSNENSSLPIIPESHFWPESHIVRSYGDTYINEVKYTNPATVYSLHGLNLITPNPGPDEVMVFTPYALHGGGYNFNTDVTRVSLEMRFWLK
jgi:hypothetical protein